MAQRLVGDGQMDAVGTHPDHALGQVTQQHVQARLQA